MFGISGKGSDFSENLFSDLTSPEFKEMAGMAKDVKGIHSRYGLEGLLGQALFNRFSGDKFNMDLSNKGLVYNPNENISLFASPDIFHEGVPRGLRIGGKFKF